MKNQCNATSQIDGRHCIKERGHLVAHQWAPTESDVQRLTRQLKDREQQLRDLAYSIVTNGSKHGADVREKLDEIFHDDVLFPNGAADELPSGD